jgi:hypothetical protein
MVFAMATSTLHAQQLITNVIVETYYISDANDATDTNGGLLEEGSVTYRVYIELSEGSSLVELFGTAANTFFIRSSAPFFNNQDRGQTYGFDIRDNRLDENTVALDSWLSMGQASRIHLGVLKAEDNDGSIIGGSNNDGGSAEMEGGLLANTDPEAGIAVNAADGLTPWPEPGFTGFAFTQFFDVPAVVFGTETNSNSFETNNFRLTVTNGVQGPTDSKLVLVAQLTTTGNLEFELNAIVRDALGVNFTYVAGNIQPGSTQLQSPHLKYTPECGCTNPDFLEYSASAPCDDGSCTTPVTFGCGDTAACNFNPNVNLNIPELCCFSPSECNGLDWTLICPALSSETEGVNDWSFYPNPATDFVEIVHPSTLNEDFVLECYSLDGKIVNSIQAIVATGTRARLNLSNLQAGTYIVQARNTKHGTMYSSLLFKTH